MNGKDIVISSRKYLGTHWEHMGRSVFGIDCTGLLVCSIRDAGGEVMDLNEYDFSDMYEELLKILRSQCIEISVKDIQEGDLLVFRAYRIYNHCGIYCGNSKFIHALNKTNIKQVIESELASVWLNSLTHVFRYKGVL
jgi:cell wall-associated NlpC family hydrolase